MQLEDYRPRSALVTSTTHISHPRFPVIDAHNHLAGYSDNWETRPVSQLLDTLDQAGVRAYVDLDGMWGEEVLHRRNVFVSSPV